MKRLLNFIYFFSLLFASLVWAGTGTSGAQFLQMGGGGRPAALGGAYVAFAQGLETVYINPAGLATMGQNEVAFTHSAFFADLSLENAGFGIPIENGAVAISMSALLSGDIERTTLSEPQGTGETYSANDYSFNFSYARKMTDKFSAGVTFKYLIMNLADVQAKGIAFDAGATYNTGVKNIRIGFAINNFGPDLRYDGQALEFETTKGDNSSQATDVNAKYQSELFQLPLTFRVGLAYDAIKSADHRLTFLADGLNPNDQSENLAVGVEYSYKDSYFIRGGHAGLADNGYENGGINQIQFTFGAGAHLKMGTTSLMLNYAFEQHKYLSNISRFTLGFIF
ncbi:MAG: PorV/PorQ family protein [Calditrichia bacterium]